MAVQNFLINAVPSNALPLAFGPAVNTNVPPAVTPSGKTKTVGGRDPGDGTVYFGASSYSGVDIKAVIHVYDTGKKEKEEIAGLQEEQSALIARRGNNTVENAGINKSVQDLTTEIQSIQDSIPAFSTKVLAEIQTLSISSFRDKPGVYSLGGVYPKGFTRGPRTIAGSMVFTLFNQQVLTDLMSTINMVDQHRPYTTVLIDQLPPFDITVVFANELGSLSRMAIYGVELLSEGQTMSVQDLLLESVVQYKALDFDPMQNVGVLDAFKPKALRKGRGISASDLLLDQGFNEKKEKSTPFLRAGARRNRFI